MSEVERLRAELESEREAHLEVCRERQQRTRELVERLYPHLDTGVVEMLAHAAAMCEQEERRADEAEAQNADLIAAVDEHKRDRYSDENYATIMDRHLWEKVDAIKSGRSETCPTCDGEGYRKDHPDHAACWTCQGTGRVWESGRSEESEVERLRKALHGQIAISPTVTPEAAALDAESGRSEVGASGCESPELRGACGGPLASADLRESGRSDLDPPGKGFGAELGKIAKPNLRESGRSEGSE